jgi:hypothetical protein
LYDADVFTLLSVVSSCLSPSGLNLNMNYLLSERHAAIEILSVLGVQVIERAANGQLSTEALATQSTEENVPEAA